MPPDFEYRPFPTLRRIVVDAGRATRRVPAIHGLIEVDVTEARRLLPGSGATLTTFVAAAVARTAAEMPEVHALRDLRGRLAVPVGVDLNLSTEVEIDGHRFPMNHVLRHAQRRRPADLAAEVHRVKASPRESDTTRLERGARGFLRLPGPVRAAALRLLRRLPGTQRRLMGTIGVTSVGMFGRGGGWGIALPVHPLTVVVGGIASRYGPDGSAREMLHLTLSFDHDVVDGAPAARFTARLRERLEGADGLGDG